MKIIHLIDYFQPSLGYQETFVAKEHNINHDVMVITSDRFKKQIFDANIKLLINRNVGVGLFIEDGIKVLRLPTLEIPFIYKPWLLSLKSSILKYNPDIIIVHGVLNFNSFRLAILKNTYVNFRYILDDHMAYNATRGGVINIFYMIFRFFCMPIINKFVDKFVAVAPITKKFMINEYNIPEEKIDVITHGVNTKLFYRNDAYRIKLRNEYGIKDNDVLFIYAGKITPDKGSDILVSATLLILKKVINIKVMFIGGADPLFIDYLKRMIEKAGFQNHFIFLSPVLNNELYKYYSSADVGVWPLQASMSMLEAMACELPVIISNKSGTPERIENNNGVIYEEGNHSDLADKMKIMLEKDLRISMGKNALTFAQNNDWMHISKKFFKKLKQ